MTGNTRNRDRPADTTHPRKKTGDTGLVTRPTRSAWARIPQSLTLILPSRLISLWTGTLRGTHRLNKSAFARTRTTSLHGVGTTPASGPGVKVRTVTGATHGRCYRGRV